jgi:hypothetical protein
MALDFPSSPVVGQTFPNPPQSGVPLWVWDGSLWQPYYTAGGGQYSAAVLNCGRFQYVSTTQCQLIPFNGASIRINGLIYQIPSGGVNLSNSGLAASTAYFVYAYMVGTTMTLEVSGTAHATDTSAANAGTEIKSGDPTRTLVGIVRTSNTSTFTDQSNARCVRSWFNRQQAALLSTQLGSNVSMGTGMSEIAPGLQLWIVAWPNENMLVQGTTQYFNNTSGAIINYQMMMDGAAIGYLVSFNGDGTGGVRPGGNPMYAARMSEGFHTFSLGHQINSGTGSTYSTAFVTGQLTQ